MDDENKQGKWSDLLDERQQKELAFARIYATDEFRHGTDGHNRLMLVVKLAELLDRVESEGHNIKEMWYPKST